MVWNSVTISVRLLTGTLPLMTAQGMPSRLAMWRSSEGSVGGGVEVASASEVDHQLTEQAEPEVVDAEDGFEAELDTARKESGLPPQNLSSPARILVPSKTLTLELEVDTSVTPVFEYFEIFMERMVMCRRAGRTLGAEFKITVNDVPVL